MPPARALSTCLVAGLASASPTPPVGFATSATVVETIGASVLVRALALPALRLAVA